MWSLQILPKQQSRHITVVLPLRLQNQYLRRRFIISPESYFKKRRKIQPKFSSLHVFSKCFAFPSTSSVQESPTRDMATMGSPVM